MVKFDTLWKNHPAVNGVESPCTTDGRPNYINQCSIRMGVCLSASGISLDGYEGNFCNPRYGHPHTHTRSVEELKKWLASGDANFVGDAEVSYRSPTTEKNRTHEAYKGKKGIVAFMNFWGPSLQGDHIDLWDGKDMAHGDPNFFERSEQIWFWKLD